jgi:hypothetical protein
LNEGWLVSRDAEASPKCHTDLMIGSPSDFRDSHGSRSRNQHTGAQIQDCLIAALRRYCQALPDLRVGKNTTFTMADFALAAFPPFFMQSPSFLAHQQHLETGQGRSNCQTLFGMNKIPGESPIHTMLDQIEPAQLILPHVRRYRGWVEIIRRPGCHARPRRAQAYRIGRNQVPLLGQGSSSELFPPQARQNKDGVIPHPAGRHAGRPRP